MVETNSSGAATASPDSEDVLKILVATDIHLGYGEKNPNTSKKTLLLLLLKAKLTFL